MNNFLISRAAGIMVMLQNSTRVKEGSKVFGLLKNVNITCTLGMEEKIRLYEGVVFATLFYGSETWG